MPDVETSVTSLYDFSSLFGERFDYERCQAGGDDLPDNQQQSMTKESNLQFKRTNNNNLYVCAFDHREDFQMALDYLTNNCANWTDVYDMPVGLEDDCIRFSLDMFIHNLRLERKIQLRRRRYELISGTGLRSSAFTPLSHLKIDDPALLLNDEITDNIDSEFSPEALLEQAFTYGFKCQTTTATGKPARTPPTDDEKENNQKKELIFSLAFQRQTGTSTTMTTVW